MSPGDMDPLPTFTDVDSSSESNPRFPGFVGPRLPRSRPRDLEIPGTGPANLTQLRDDARNQINRSAADLLVQSPLLLSGNGSGGQVPPVGTTNQAIANPTDLITAQLSEIRRMMSRVVDRYLEQETSMRQLSARIEQQDRWLRGTPQLITSPEIPNPENSSGFALRGIEIDRSIPRTQLNFDSLNGTPEGHRNIQAPINSSPSFVFTPPINTSAIRTSVAGPSSVIAQVLGVEPSPMGRSLGTTPSRAENLQPPLPRYGGRPPQSLWVGSSAFASHSQVPQSMSPQPDDIQREPRPAVISIQGPREELTFPPSPRIERRDSRIPESGYQTPPRFLTPRRSEPEDQDPFIGNDPGSIKRYFAQANAEFMKEMNSKLHKATSSAPEIDKLLEEARRTPFTRKITRVQIRDPRKMRLPEYDGTKDPRAHVKAFMLAISRAHLSEEEFEAGHCRYFAESLKDSAFEWFSGLKGNSIDNFDQLIKAFLKQYSVFIEIEVSEADLWTISQGENESLRSYIDRFKAIKAKISNINQQLGLRALQRGVWHESRFFEELQVNTPTNLDDALHRANRFILMEEKQAEMAALFRNPRNQAQPGNQEPEDPEDEDLVDPMVENQPEGATWEQEPLSFED